MVGEEVDEVIRARRFRSEDLLDFLAACELEQDCRAFNGCTTFQMVSCFPGDVGRILRRGVQSTEVDHCCFESHAGARWRRKEKGPRGCFFWYRSLGEDVGCWKTEGNNSMMRFEIGGERELVEYISFVILDEKENTERQCW